MSIQFIFCVREISAQFTLEEFNSDNDNYLELCSETNDIHSVESMDNNFRFHENVAETSECKLGILAFELEKLFLGYFRFYV